MARRPAPRRPARKPARRATGKKPARATRPAAPPTTEREKIIAAFLSLLAEKPFERIGLSAIAKEAGVSLASLRGEFPSTLAIVAAHIKATDRAVLAEDASDMGDEPARDRLADVLMRRLDILAPHRGAVRSLLRSARRDPPLALALNALALRSQRWMLNAAGIGAAGPLGVLRAQGLAVLFAGVLDTWTRDDEGDQARTMAALDRALARGERLAGLLDDLCAIPARLYRMRPRPASRRRRGKDSGETAAA
jgi:AcrR family transcriptional regulator